MEATCEDLWVLDVSNPTVSDQSGDGVISPGETLDVRVDLNEIAGYGWNMYPGVDFKSDQPGVSVKWNDWYYAIAACERIAGATAVISTTFHGTQVTITARVACNTSVRPPTDPDPLTIQ
jgi:hypothetical protein